MTSEQRPDGSRGAGVQGKPSQREGAASMEALTGHPTCWRKRGRPVWLEWSQGWVRTQRELDRAAAQGLFFWKVLRKDGHDLTFILKELLGSWLK